MILQSYEHRCIENRTVWKGRVVLISPIWSSMFCILLRGLILLALPIASSNTTSTSGPCCAALPHASLQLFMTCRCPFFWTSRFSCLLEKGPFSRPADLVCCSSYLAICLWTSEGQTDWTLYSHILISQVFFVCIVQDYNFLLAL